MSYRQLETRIDREVYVVVEWLRLMTAHAKVMGINEPELSFYQYHYLHHPLSVFYFKLTHVTEKK